MEVSGALLGVRTRSRTLALQRTDGGKGEEEPAGTGDYLELRSRRLVKPPPPPTKDKEASAARWAAAAAAARRKEATAAEGFEAAADLEASFGDNVLDWDAAVERYQQDFLLFPLFSGSIYSFALGNWGFRVCLQLAPFVLFRSTPLTPPLHGLERALGSFKIHF